MKYIVPKNDLADLKAKLQSWMTTIYHEKYYHKVKKWVSKYLNLCTNLYMNNTDNISVNKLIKKYFHGSKMTFYIWAKKIINGYCQDNFYELQFKSTTPKNIKYQFSLETRKQICDYYFDYKFVGAGGVLSLYHNIHQKNVHDIDTNNVPKSINTFYRWIKQDKRYGEIKTQMKKAKRHFKRYEVSEIGLLQMDAKVFTDKNFPIAKHRLYVYDFIDEITRIAFGYVYDSLGTNNAINAMQRAMKDFGELGITIKRIRTDNAPEFTTTNWSNKKAYKVKERPFTTFLSKNGIIHETTPIRSPQSNGKIERFHRNYNSLFWFKKCGFEIKFDVKQLQIHLNEWYAFYNFKRKHKSLNYKTPFETLNKFIIAK
ncbi:integrase core domain-containing protein [Spiroplasma endosymbiont of Clivina fossor]|uniref:integrase core domain-containing protein n=1 Tax=Spiroplasma endosymbiont of Clivina fossor TaxID=3066282 RepID=UPI00313DA759